MTTRPFRKRHSGLPSRRSPRRRHLCAPCSCGHSSWPLLFCSRVVAGAQVPTTRPTPEQAQILLQTRPDLVAQLRQRFATSGLTREQVHARLRAEGYPEDLLDAYLPGMTGTPHRADRRRVLRRARARHRRQRRRRRDAGIALGSSRGPMLSRRPVRIRSVLLPAYAPDQRAARHDRHRGAARRDATPPARRTTQPHRADPAARPVHDAGPDRHGRLADDADARSHRPEGRAAR